MITKSTKGIIYLKLLKKTDGTNYLIPLKDSIGNLPSLDPLLREGIEFTLGKFPDFKKKERKFASYFYIAGELFFILFFL